MNGSTDGGNTDITMGGAPFTLDLETPPDAGGALIPGGADGGTGGAGGGEGGTATQIPENVARMIADSTKARVEAEQRAQRAEQDAEELRRSRAQQWTPQQQQQQRDPQQVRDEIARKLNERFMQDPGGTLADIMLTSQQLAQQSAQGAAAGVASGQAELIINGFVQDRERDPSFAIVKDTFMQMLNESRAATPPEQLARATPGQIRESLEGLYERAAGRAALGNYAKRSRDNFPPGYNTGSSGAAGGASIAGGKAGANEMSPRDAVEREIVESAKSYNMSDEHILSALRAHREDQ